MAGTNKTTSPFDLIPDTLDKVLEILQGVGIHLPPFLVQFFLLALVVVAFSWMLMQVRRRKKKPLLLVLGTAGLALVALGIIYNWIEQVVFPLPKELTGTIELRDPTKRYLLVDMRVVLLDYRSERLSPGVEMVDTTNGRFTFQNKGGFGIRPRILRIITPECVQDYPLSRGELRAGVLTITFSCGGEK
jgi:hypothetical protein